jgi:glutathione S-transferase
MTKPTNPLTMADKPQKIIPTIHNLAHSQAFRCVWALEELKVLNPTFQFHILNYPRMNPHNYELAKHHRLGKSPIMTLETTDNSPVPTPQLEPGVLTESVLILQYINDTYANHLWDPKSAEDQKRNHFFTQFATDTLSLKTQFAMLFDLIPSIMPFPLNYILGAVFSPIKTHFLKDVQPIYQLLEDYLSDEKPWFGGERMGLADFNMSWGLDMGSHRGYLDGVKYPKVGEWVERIRAREGYKRAVEVSGGELDLKWFGQKK